jgi:hypothetical protein
LKNRHNNGKAITKEGITLIYKLRAITVRSNSGSLPERELFSSVIALCDNAKM